MIGPRVRAVAALATVFALGAFGGVAWERHRTADAVVAPVTEDEHLRRMAEMQEELDLTDEQVDAINDLMARHQETVQHIWEELRPEVRHAIDGVHMEISELLTGSQRERFHEWLLREQLQHEGGRHH